MRILIVATRIIKQLIKDKRSIALLFIAPIFILFLLSVILNGNVSKPNIQAVSLPAKLVSELKENANITEVSDKNTAMNNLRNRKTDAVLTIDGNTLTTNLEGTESIVSGAVKKAVSASASLYMKSKLDDAKEKLTKIPNSKLDFDPLETDFKYIHNSDDISTFDSVSSTMMVFFIFFFVFIMAGVAFLRERITGTLDRLLSTPIKRIEIVLGYFLGFGVFVFFQTLLIQLFMIYGLKVNLSGNFFTIFLINFLMAASSLSLGTLLSAFARNEFQLFQFIPIAIVPQILFCGLFDLRGTPSWTSAVSKIFPLTYANDALINIAVRGMTLSSIYIDLIVLLAFTVFFLVLNSLALKKYRVL